MKMIYLAFSRLKQYYITNKLIFSMFLLGSVVCGIISIYFYSVMLENIEKSLLPGLAGRMYEISLQAERISHSAPVLDTLREKQPEDLLLISYISGENVSLKIGGTARDYPKGYLIAVAASVYDKASLVLRSGRMEFSPEEAENAARVVVAYRDGRQEVGDEFFFFQEPYRIIGTHRSALMPECVVPYRTFQEIDLPADQIVLILPEPLSREANQALENELQALFPNAYIQHPYLYYQRTAEALPQQLAVIAAAYVVALLSFVFLLTFIMDKQRYENIVYGICGASKRRMAAILALESLILAFVIALLSVAAYQALHVTLFRLMGIGQAGRRTAADYGLVFLFLTAVTALVNLPFMVSAAKNSLILLKNRYR